MSLSEVEVFGPELENARESVETSLFHYSEPTSDCPTVLADAIRYCLTGGGKRLRPMLVLSAAKLCGAESIEVAMPAACAVEMIHTYSLIHDDLPAMDDDDLRRGKPSCHVQFDEATAILTGDALIPLAFEIITRDLPTEIAVRCVQELSAAAGANNLVGGQVDDLRLQNTDIDVETLEAIHRRKTGALFVTSLRLGCICSRGSEHQLNALTKYGQKLGLAFQVTDDLLDCCGEETKIGKRTGKDAALGKRTYPDLIGVEASRDLVAKLRDEAVNSMQSLGDDASDLIRFANFVVERNF